MAKVQLGGTIAIEFNSSGNFVRAVANLTVGTTDDNTLRKVYHKNLTLTGAQITAVQNFLDNKFAELKSDEGIA